MNSQIHLTWPKMGDLDTTHNLVREAAEANFNTLFFELANITDGGVKSSNYVSNSIVETTCSYTIGSRTMTVASSSTFEVGQGVSIEGAGVPVVNNGWLVTTITAVHDTLVTLAMFPLATGSNKRFLHDDSVALQEAFTKTPLGGTLILDHDSIYAVNINGHSDMRVVGQTFKSKILAPPYVTNPEHVYSVDANVLLFSMCSNFVIDNIQIDGGSLRGVDGDIYNGVIGIRIDNATNFGVANCKIEHSKYIGIRMQGACSEFSIFHNAIQHTDTGIHCYGEIQLYRGDIEFNYIYGGTSEGIDIISGTSTASYADHINVRHNTIDGKVCNFYGSKSTNCEWSYNTIRNGESGIVCKDSYTESQPTISSMIHIHHNYIYNMRSTGIQFGGYDLTIDSNKCVGCALDGITGTSDIVNDRGDIANNTIINCGTADGYKSLRLVSLKNYTVSGNKFDTAGKEAIHFDSPLTLVKVFNNHQMNGTQMPYTFETLTTLDVEIYNNTFSGFASWSVDPTQLASKGVKFHHNEMTDSVNGSDYTIAANNTSTLTLIAPDPAPLTVGAGSVLQTLFAGYDGQEKTLKSKSDSVTIGVADNIVLAGGAQKVLKSGGELTLKYLTSKSKWYEVRGIWPV